MFRSVTIITRIYVGEYVFHEMSERNRKSAFGTKICMRRTVVAKMLEFNKNVHRCR